MSLRGAGCLLCVLALSLAWTGGLSTAARADEPERYLLRIASQPLEQALQEFARQSGIQIIFFSRLTAELRSPALDGQYTLAAALTTLLAESDLSFRVINPKTIEIQSTAAGPPGTASRAAPPRSDTTAARERSTRSLTRGTAKSNPMDEVVVSATAEGLVATRTATPLRAIPQTVSIISREQMRQQGDTDLADALGHAPGITLVRRDSLD